MENFNQKLTETEKFVEIKSAQVFESNDDNHNKFKLSSKAALMQVNIGRMIYESFL